MNEYTSKNRHKYYLKAHLIFVCKYRKQLLKGDIDDTVKSCFSEESDKDHIHLLITYSPDISLISTARRLKQKSVHVLWNKHAQFLTDYFRKEHTFRSESCFMCSIGEADPDTIRKYIEKQG